MANGQCSKFVEEQQLLHWHYYTKKRMQFQEKLCESVCIPYVLCVITFVHSIVQCPKQKSQPVKNEQLSSSFNSFCSGVNSKSVIFDFQDF